VAIVLARVDNRLVHGQVLEVWAPRLLAEVIVAIDRGLAQDGFQRRLVEGLSRCGVEVRVTSPEDAFALVHDLAERKRVLIVIADLQQALDASRGGLNFPSINLGNLHSRPGARPLTTSVYVTADDLVCLSAFRAAGVPVDARAVPSDKSPDVWAILGPTLEETA
jgi:mannose/fructose/N-acetylgalactosamine-specific phosphotransferase system component IIB